MANLIDSIVELVAKIGDLEERNVDLSQKLKVLECSGEVYATGKSWESDKSERSPTPSSSSIIELNPMKLPEILQLLLTYVRPKTLPHLRLVCKLWDTQVKGHMVKRTLFKLSLTNIASVSEFEKLTKTSFHGFWNLFIDLAQCHTYHRHLEWIDKIVAESGNQLRNFRFRFPQNCLYRIQNFREKYFAHLNNIEYLGLLTVPPHFSAMPIFPPGSRKVFNSLRRIRIARVCVPRSTEIGFWTDLFLSAPNLVELELNGINTKGGLEATDFRDAIHAISEIKPDRLRILKIMSTVEEASVEKLIHTNLELDSLRIYSFRCLDVELTTSKRPQIQPLALNYGETYCVDMTKTLMELLGNEFTALQDSGTKVRCIGLLKIFQSKLDHLLVPRIP